METKLRAFRDVIYAQFYIRILIPAAEPATSPVTVIVAHSLIAFWNKARANLVDH